MSINHTREWAIEGEISGGFISRGIAEELRALLQRQDALWLLVGQ